MVILLIVILQLVSTALWVTSSGMVVQRKIRNRVNAVANKSSREITQANNQLATESGISMDGVNEIKDLGDKARNFGNNALNVANKVSVSAMRTARLVVNLIKTGLMVLLPLVLLLDIIVAVIVVTVGGGVLAVYSAMDGSMQGSTYNTTIGGNGTTGTGTTVIQGTSSKIILVGDSRTYGLAITAGGLSTNEANEIIGSMGSDYVICKGGMGYDYMVNHTSDIETQLSEGTAVVIAMGINGCGPVSGETPDNFSERYASQYASWLNEKASAWAEKGVAVYFVSINPVNESMCEKSGYTLKNSYIEAVNSKIKSKTQGKVGYIDTYSLIFKDVMSGNAFFSDGDGLHYSSSTYGVIKDYIWKVVKGG